MKTLFTLILLILTQVSYSQLNLQTQSIDPSCNGYNDGEITIDISGGVSPYIINGLEISGTQFIASTLSGGQYQFDVVDQNQNSQTISIVLNDPQPLSIQILTTGVTTWGGNDGSANITILNGVATYNWSGTGTGFITNQEDQYGLTEGIYNVEITATDGCQYNKRVIITQPPAATLPGVINPQTQGFVQNPIVISQ